MSKKPFLFLGFLVVVAMVVVGVLVQQPTTSSSDAAAVNSTGSANANSAKDSSSPVELEHGVKLLQPATTTSVGSLTTYRFNDTATLSVMPEALQQAVLSETPVKSETEIKVGGVTGKQLTITSAKDGSEGVVVQVLHNQQLYDFRGSEEFLANLDSFIKFKQ